MADSPDRKGGASPPGALQPAAELEELRTRLRRLEKLVSEQRPDDAATAPQHQLHRLLRDSKLLGMISWDTAGDILDANDAFLAMAGYTRDDLRSGRLCWQRITPPEYAELDRASASQMHRTGRCAPFEKEYVRGDGSRVPVLIISELVDGERGRGVSYVLDLTERKRYEERMLRQQLLDSLGAVIGGTAHDFNNLLTTIVCNASVALHQLPADAPLRAHLEHIQRASKQAAELCAQMQAYATPALGGDLSELDLGALAREVCERATPMMASNVVLALDAIERDIHVTAQRQQLETVVLALLSNACEAISDSGTITVSTGIGLPAPMAKAIVTAEPEPANRYAILTVRDDGVGMDPDTARHMFDPFFSTKFLGRGMSLAAAHGIVSAHGGLIEVDTAPASGTAVRILLPMADSVH